MAPLPKGAAQKPIPKLHNVTVIRRKRIALSTHDDLLRKLSLAFDSIGPQNERHGYIVALLAVGDYLMAHGANSRHVVKLGELASALSDLDVGTVRSLLQPAPVDNRPTGPSNIWRRRAFVALGIEALITGGALRNEAADVAERTVKSIHDLAGNTKPRNAALSWNDELAKGRIKNLEAVHIFQVGCETIGKTMAGAAHDPSALKRLSATWFYLADLTA
jgi:hypothetical protein